MLKPQDQPLSIDILLALFPMLIITSFGVGGLMGGIAWVGAAGMVRPRDRTARWLYTDPQMPIVTELCMKFLDAVSRYRPPHRGG